LLLTGKYVKICFVGFYAVPDCFSGFLTIEQEVCCYIYIRRAIATPVIGIIEFMKTDSSGKGAKEQGPLYEVLSVVFPLVKYAAFFSLFTSILVLTPSLYMLEVYDRVVNSRNHTTLLMLTILVVGLYLILELLEWVRREAMHDAGMRFDQRVRGRVFGAMFAARLRNFPGSGVQALRDLKTIRDFFPSTAFLSIIDAPFALMVLVLLFLMNSLLGWFAVVGAVVQFAIGFMNERRVREPLQEASRSAMQAQAYAQGAIRNAQVIESMGMLDHVFKRWVERQHDFVFKQAVASDYAGTNTALSKMIQGLLSSLLLGVGCWLALRGDLGGALMIVASILGGRVLAPLVQIIGNWRVIESFREAWVRTDALLRDFPEEPPSMPLPAPKGALSVEGVIAGPPNSPLQILKGVSFRIAPGEALAIIGPSASGKTTLARLLVGIWNPMSGKVRLDGSDIYAWNKDELGPHIGYLPQNVELFEGTIADNICRFGSPDRVRLEEAARMAGIGHLIETLPKGFDTPVGDDGAFLSGGERQRVALARAVYGDPKFVVLDEPNASLDEAGEAALQQAIRELKVRGCTVVIITQRKTILPVIDKILVLVDGQARKFGLRDEVLSAMQPSPPNNGAQPSVQLAGGVA